MGQRIGGFDQLAMEFLLGQGGIGGEIVHGGRGSERNVCRKADGGVIRDP